MTTIKLLRSDGVWKVVGKTLLSQSLDLEWAAFDALLLAELHGASIELGEGVPEDALERALERIKQLDAFRGSRR